MKGRLDRLIERDGAFHAFDWGDSSAPKEKGTIISYSERTGYEYLEYSSYMEGFAAMDKKLRNLGRNKFDTSSQEMRQMTDEIKSYNDSWSAKHFHDIPWNYLNYTINQDTLEFDNSKIYLFPDGNVALIGEAPEDMTFENIELSGVSDVHEALVFGLYEKYLASGNKGYGIFMIPEIDSLIGGSSNFYKNNLFKNMLRDNFGKELQEKRDELWKMYEYNGGAYGYDVKNP